MPYPNAFRALGVFILDNFLTGLECAACLTAVAVGTDRPAAVRKEGHDERVDERRRRTRLVAIEGPPESQVRVRLNDIRPALEQHFGHPLEACETPQFLRYASGDFYCAHTDGSSERDAPSYLRHRRVSTVVFLNEQSEKTRAGCYGGGELIFYGLIRDARFALCGLPLQSKAGMLVAFPCDVVHEVRPVTHGERWTVATWFAGTSEGLPHLADPPM